jgi:hypothetical protein
VNCRAYSVAVVEAVSRSLCLTLNVSRSPPDREETLEFSRNASGEPGVPDASSVRRATSGIRARSI